MSVDTPTFAYRAVQITLIDVDANGRLLRVEKSRRPPKKNVQRRLDDFALWQRVRERENDHLSVLNWTIVDASCFTSTARSPTHIAERPRRALGAYIAALRHFDGLGRVEVRIDGQRLVEVALFARRLVADRLLDQLLDLRAAAAYRRQIVVVDCNIGHRG